MTKLIGLAALQALFTPRAPVFSFFDLTPWKRNFRLSKKGIASPIMASRSKYQPHQGEREMARRVKQIKEGKIR